jgi:hypothetical protein
LINAIEDSVIVRFGRVFGTKSILLAVAIPSAVVPSVLLDFQLFKVRFV